MNDYKFITYLIWIWLEIFLDSKQKIEVGCLVEETSETVDRSRDQKDLPTTSRQSRCRSKIRCPNDAFDFT